jgi:hypothetical protein
MSRTHIKHNCVVKILKDKSVIYKGENLVDISGYVGCQVLAIKEENRYLCKMRPIDLDDETGIRRLANGYSYFIFYPNEIELIKEMNQI